MGTNSNTDELIDRVAVLVSGQLQRFIYRDSLDPASGGAGALLDLAGYSTDTTKVDVHLVLQNLPEAAESNAHLTPSYIRDCSLESVMTDII